MSRNGSGTYNLPAGNPVVTGSTISSTWANSTLNDIATALTGSVAKDGQTTPTANLPMGNYVHTGVGVATLRNQYASASQVQDSATTLLTGISGTNTIVATAALGMTAYATGQVFTFVPAVTNTGATTININAIGAKSITKNGATALASGDIVAGTPYQIFYDGTQFQLLAPSFLSSLSASSGSSLIGYTQGGTGAVATTVQTKLRETINVKDFGAVGDGVANDATAIQNAINAAATTSGIVIFPVGTYLINTALSLIGKYVSIIGAGQTNTIIKANASLTSVFDINETSDVIVSPFVIQDLKIDGNNTTTNGINVRYRHQSVVRNVYIVNCTNGMTEKDTWNNYRENVRIDSCGISFNLVGSNHNSHWNRCTTTGFTTYGIKVQSLGTALDGNLGLLFSACDVEFGTGGGVYFDGSSATFDTCYLGETVSSAIFTMVSGIVLIEGGLFLMGYTSNSIGFVLTGGSIEYRSGLIASQGALALSGVCSSTNGKIAFIQCNINQVTGGTQVSTGDILNNGPVATVYASRYGKNYTTATFNANATITTTTPANPIGKTLTVSSVTGASPAIVGFSIPLINTSEWQPNGKMYFVVVYSSNKAFQAKLSNGVWGVAPERSLGTLPSTSGVISTYLKMDQTFNTNAYTTLEIYNDAPAATDTFTLYNVYLADQAFINTGANLTNLYKC